MNEPRRPFLRVQRFGQMTSRGFSAIEVWVLDWDHEWWMWTWCWERLKVRRNLLLTSIEGLASLDSEDENGSDRADQQRKGS